MAILWTLGRFEKFGTWFYQISKTFNKKWRFYMWRIYLDKKIPNTEYENGEVYFKNEVTGDFLYEILGEEWKWYKKDNPQNVFENYYFCLNILPKNMILSVGKP